MPAKRKTFDEALSLWEESVMLAQSHTLLSSLVP